MALILLALWAESKELQGVSDLRVAVLGRQLIELFQAAVVQHVDAATVFADDVVVMSVIRTGQLVANTAIAKIAASQQRSLFQRAQIAIDGCHITSAFRKAMKDLFGGKGSVILGQHTQNGFSWAGKAKAVGLDLGQNFRKSIVWCDLLMFGHASVIFDILESKSQALCEV